MKIKVAGILISTLVIIAGLSVATNTFSEVKDQYQELHTYEFWLVSSTPIWQEFVPTKNNIVRAEIKVMQGYGGSPPLTLEIHKPYGTSLASIDVPVGDIPDTPGWVSFDIPDIPLNPGETYYIGVVYKGSGEYAVCGAGGNPYTEGESDRGPMWDWCFRTFADEDVSPDLTVQVNGGFGVNVVIRNVGTTDASNIAYTITLSGIVLYQQNYGEVISSIPAGGVITVSSGFIFAFGNGQVSVSVGDINLVKDAYFFGPFALIAP